MEIERRSKEVIINMTQEEVLDLQRGEIICDYNRESIYPNAKIEILPLRNIEPDNSLKNQWSIDKLTMTEETPLKGLLFSNGDLQIAIPAIKLIDTKPANMKLSRDSISTRGVKKGKEMIRHIVPPKGIKLNLGNSFKTVNFPDYFV